MGPTVGFVLLTILCASVGGVQGECRHVENEDMIEYTCVGGHPSDLNNLPADTGKIRISNMAMPRITPDTFSRFGSDLWVLACSYCGIQDIDPGAFHKLDSLQQLSLDNNRLTSVREDWFVKMDYLTYLDLNYNNIETIENGVFENLPSLVDLRLSGNRLECLNLDDMSHLSSLRRIFLSENPELKCPNAISRFLEDQGVSFEKDPEWSKIPTDLVDAEIPPEYDDWEITTPLPAFRERLHLTPSATSPPEEPRTIYPSTRYHPTEEVFYSTELVTPSWVTTEEAGTRSPPPEHTPTPESTTLEPYWGRPWLTYKPPSPVLPPEHPPNVNEDSHNSPAISRPSPEFSGPDPINYDDWTDDDTEGDIDDSYWSPYGVENEGDNFGTTYHPDRSRPDVESYTQRAEEHSRDNDQQFEEPHYTTRIPRPPTELSSGSINYSEWSDGDQHTEGVTDTSLPSSWVENESVSIANRYPLDIEEPMPEESTSRVNRPPPPSIPEAFQPSSPDNVFDTPYYEPPVTIPPPPPLDNYQERQEESTLDAQSIETTTTDKPLPECPNSGPSQSIGRPFLHLIILPTLLVFMRNVLVEGF